MKEIVLFGEFPERSNGADCKSVGSAFEGSNPPLPIARKSICHIDLRVFFFPHMGESLYHHSLLALKLALNPVFKPVNMRGVFLPTYSPNLNLIERP